MIDLCFPTLNRQRRALLRGQCVRATEPAVSHSELGPMSIVTLARHLQDPAEIRLDKADRWTMFGIKATTSYYKLVVQS